MEFVFTSWRCLTGLEIKVMTGWLDMSLEFPGEIQAGDLRLRMFSIHIVLKTIALGAIT